MWDEHGFRDSTSMGFGWQRASKAAEAQMPALLQETRASAVINSDETSVRVNGQTWWHWVFCAVTVVVHVIRKTRGFTVITEVLGKTPQVEVWGSDCLAAQMKTPATPPAARWRSGGDCSCSALRQWVGRVFCYVPISEKVSTTPSIILLVVR
jgi:hypothetical protein